MKSVTVEYQRFGDPTGVLRLSDRYIRTVGITEPTEEVSFGLPQENLTRAMASLDYGRFGGEGESAREQAERVLKGLAPHVEQFLCAKTLLDEMDDDLQIDVVARPLELAQLPFEIIEETQPKLVVTRRLRQPWPLPAVVEGDQPKILFAWASPRRMDVPHERHRALLDAIVADLGSADAIVEVEHATRAKLSQELDGKQPFTHFHLLAHGVAGVDSDAGNPLDLNQKTSPSAMLALETEDGKVDRCSAEELARWLSLGPRPQVVTVATCHSAEVDPIESGGTIAHTLHAAGVRIVLASQLALTQDGSDFLVSAFLKRVIEGEDPRLALRICRDELRKNSATTYYDRVALVGYVHVDPDLEGRLAERSFRVALTRLDAISADARNRIERVVESLSPTKDLTTEQREEMEAILRRFEEVRKGLAKLEPDPSLSKAQREELLGLQASSLKREAEATHSMACNLAGDAAEVWRQRSRTALCQATEAYGRAARISRDHHWTWVQWLVLLAVRDGDGIQQHSTDWAIAEATSRDAAERTALPGASPKERQTIATDAMWAWGSLFELHLLGPLVGRPAALDDAKKCLDALVAASQALGKPSAIASTRNQLARYKSWWGADPTFKLPIEIVTAATDLYTYLLKAGDGTK